MKIVDSEVAVKTPMQSSEKETRIQRAALVCMPPLSSSSVFLSSQSSPLQSDLLCHHQLCYIIFQDPLFPVSS